MIVTIHRGAYERGAAFASILFIEQEKEAQS